MIQQKDSVEKTKIWKSRNAKLAKGTVMSFLTPGLWARLGTQGRVIAERGPRSHIFGEEWAMWRERGALPPHPVPCEGTFAGLQKVCDPWGQGERTGAWLTPAKAVEWKQIHSRSARHHCVPARKRGTVGRARREVRLAARVLQSPFPREELEVSPKRPLEGEGRLNWLRLRVCEATQKTRTSVPTAPACSRFKVGSRGGEWGERMLNIASFQKDASCPRTQRGLEGGQASGWTKNKIWIHILGQKHWLPNWGFNLEL